MTARVAVRRGATVAVVLVLVAAAVFGLWHVFGGLVNGNPRAAAFGGLLAGASGAVLVLGWLLVRRVPRA